MQPVGFLNTGLNVWRGGRGANVCTTATSLVYNCCLPGIAWGAHSKFWTGPPAPFTSSCCTALLHPLHSNLAPCTPFPPCNPPSCSCLRGKLPPPPVGRRVVQAGWLGLQEYKLYLHSKGFLQLLAEDASQMWRLKIHVTGGGQGQVILSSRPFAFMAGHKKGS